MGRSPPALCGGAGSRTVPGSNEKPKRCADLHNVNAVLGINLLVRLRSIGIVRNPLNPVRLGDWWATNADEGLRRKIGAGGAGKVPAVEESPRVVARLSPTVRDRSSDGCRKRSEEVAG